MWRLQEIYGYEILIDNKFIANKYLIKICLNLSALKTFYKIHCPLQHRIVSLRGNFRLAKGKTNGNRVLKIFSLLQCR